VIEFPELLVEVLLVLLWLWPELWSPGLDWVDWLPMLLGDELCVPALLGLVLLGVLAPDCPAAPLDDVSWANDKLPAKHTVAKKTKLFFIWIQASDVLSVCITLERTPGERYPVLSLT
jgi:hypothetical protein